jgi:predicted metalloenzyme YecM
MIETNLLDQIFLELHEFEQESNRFLRDLLSNKYREFEIDHLAIQASTEKDGKNLVQQILNKYSAGPYPFSVATVSGREVFVFKLKTHLTFLGQEIWYLELLFPKENVKYMQSSLDHIEVVIPYTGQTSSYADYLSEVIGRQNFERAKSYYAYKESKPKALGIDNPETISISFTNSKGKSIKFHPLSLLETIIREKLIT